MPPSRPATCAAARSCAASSPTCSCRRLAARVCDLCTDRAAHEGWIREGLDDVHRARPAHGGRRSRSRPGRLGSRRDGGAADDFDERPAPDPEPVAELPPDAPRSVHGVPTNAELKLARALDLFNGRSSIRRTVAGVARSLGAPIVARGRRPTRAAS